MVNYGIKKMPTGKITTELATLKKYQPSTQPMTLAHPMKSAFDNIFKLKSKAVRQYIRKDGRVVHDYQRSK